VPIHFYQKNSFFFTLYSFLRVLRFSHWSSSRFRFSGIWRCANG
jgi:hypothetical protein